MLVKRIEEVEAKAVEMAGAVNVRVRVVFGPADGAPTFAMRVFELGAEGQTPYHAHEWEHEVVVLDGDIVLVSEDGERRLGAGDAVMIPGGEKHCFANRSQEKGVSFLCMIPVEYQK